MRAFPEQAVLKCRPNHRGFFMKYSLLSLLAVSTLLCADTLTLINDSDYDLKAVIHNSDGKKMGEVNLPSHADDSWSSPGELGGLTEEGPNGFPPPMTAIYYTVTWYCSRGEEFSSCDEVYNESTVTANGCPGNQQCGMGLSLPQ